MFNGKQNSVTTFRIEISAQGNRHHWSVHSNTKTQKHKKRKYLGGSETLYKKVNKKSPDYELKKT